MKKDRLKNSFKTLITMFFILVFYVLLLKVLNINCPLKELTGISCPGCGMTRAMMNVITLNFNEAYYYHPLCFVFPFFVIILFVFYVYELKKSFKFILYVLVILFLGVYIYRIIYGDGIVVSFEPENNIIFRLIKVIRGN